MKESNIELLKKFSIERNWDQFHTPVNLAKSIVIEASELLELFQWSEEAKSLEDVKDELADILTYVYMLALKYDIDLDEAVFNKIKKNEKKYPVSKAYGNSKKYTEYDEEKE